MWPDKLKINKQLSEAMLDYGFQSPKEIQEKSMTRIMGGQDLIGVGPAGCGKTSTYVLSIIMKLKYAFEEAPRAIVLVPDNDKVTSVLGQFQILAQNTNLRFLGAQSGVGMEPQLDALADGVDVIIGTPDRVRALYLKLGLNVNKVVMFVLDDAEWLIKQGFQLPVSELARSLPKCQHLVFTEVMHDKLEKMIAPFLNYPQQIETSGGGESTVDTYELLLYRVPNFKTKLNLLNLLLATDYSQGKGIIIANTEATADKIYASITKRFGEKEILLNLSPNNPEILEEFENEESARIIILPSTESLSIDSKNIAFIIQLEVPEIKETFLSRIIRKPDDQQVALKILTFATDIELILVKKVENFIGKIIDNQALPQDLKIEINEQGNDLDGERNSPKKKVAEETITGGGAFHEKKPSNLKQYNYGYKDKQKMKGKISKRRNG